MSEVLWLPAHGFKWDAAPTPAIYPQIITGLMSNIKPWHYDTLLQSPWQLGLQKKSDLSLSLPLRFAHCRFHSFPQTLHHQILLRLRNLVKKKNSWLVEVQHVAATPFFSITELYLHSLLQWPHSVQLHWFFFFFCYPAGYFTSLECTV